MKNRFHARGSALLLVLLAFPLARPNVAWAGAASDSLIDRAHTVLGRYGDARRSPAQRQDVRIALLSMADTLAAASQDSLAAACLDCAGILSFQSGELDEAQATWARAVGHAEAAGDPGLIVRCLNSRAVGFAVSGDYEKAIAMFTEQIPIRESIGDSRGLGTVWANLANAYKALGRIPESIEAEEEALLYHRASNNAEGLSGVYGSLADLLATVDNLPRALAWGDSAVAIARRHQLPDALGNGLVNLSVAQLGAGLVDEALASLDEALEVHTANANPYYAAWARAARGEPLIRLGRAEEFLRSLQDARAQGVTYEDPVLVARNKTLEGIALLETGRLAEAESRLNEAVGDVERTRGSLEDKESIAALLRSSIELRAALARCLLQRGDPERAWSTVERGCNDGKAPIALDELAAILAADRAVLVQLVDPEIGPRIAFRITPDGLEVRQSSSGTELRRRLRPVLDLLASGADDAACAPALRSLGAELLPDLLEGMPDDVQRLYVVAPSRLSGFPLEALPVLLDDGREVPLGELRLVTYLPSATTLRELRGRETATEGMLAFADPTPGDTLDDLPDALPHLRRLRETPLPYAREEAREIATKDARVFVGMEATTEAATGSFAQSAAVIHFATHADVNPIRAGQSSLLLSNGQLTADEIGKLHLRADLLTLSGCRTGGGYTVLAEGSLGLARAFLRAGTRSVVGSAWDVEDRAAKQFMSLLYEELRRGRGRDEALRSARRGMAKAGFPPRDRYAFVLVGLGNLPVESLAGSASRTTALRRRIALGLLAAVALVAIGILARRR